MSRAGRVGFKLWAKHRLVTSPLAAPLENLREILLQSRNLRRPELALRRQEGRMTRGLLQGMVGKGWACADVGAHIGSFSYLIDCLTPQGPLYIIEAIEAKAKLLQARFPNAKVFANAVSNQAGQVSFFENLSAPGYSSLADRKNHGATREIHVEARKLDDLIPEDERLDLLKLDVEGFEYQALLGAQRILQEFRPVILFEAGPMRASDGDNEDYNNLFRMLDQEMDYDVRAVFDVHYEREPINLSIFQRYRQYPFLAFNYFAFPREGKTNLLR